MPIIQVNKKDLDKLLGIALSDEKIRNYLPKLKCELENLDKEMIEYEVTHDRPDLFSVEGLSRALKGFLGLESGLPFFKIEENTVNLYLEGPRYRPYALGAIVKDVELSGEAIKQFMALQEKLHLTYCRNRRKVSIGLYDLDTITPPVYYSKALPKKVRLIPLEERESLTLDEILERTKKGKEYYWLVKGNAFYPILKDSRGKVLSFPPIINSEDTKVTSSTKNIFVDVTGTDLNLMSSILDLVVTSIAERSKSKNIQRINVYHESKLLVKSPKLELKSLKIDPSFVENISGFRFSVNSIIKYLKIMRHDATSLDENYVLVKVAPYRLDILHPIDLVEDILSSYGYENIIPEPLYSSHFGKIHPIEYISKKFREILIGLNFQEIINYMLSNPTVLLRKMRIKEKFVAEIKNPKMEKYTAVRNWLIPGLLEVTSLNSKREQSLKIFEIGDVVIFNEKSDTKTKSERHLSYVLMAPDLTLTDGLVVLKAILKSFNIEYKLVSTTHPSFITGRFAKILWDRDSIGYIGELHPEVLYNFEIENPVVASEINLSKVLSLISNE